MRAVRATVGIGMQELGKQPTEDLAGAKALATIKACNINHHKSVCRRCLVEVIQGEMDNAAAWLLLLDEEEQVDKAHTGNESDLEHFPVLLTAASSISEDGGGSVHMLTTRDCVCGHEHGSLFFRATSPDWPTPQDQEQATAAIALRYNSTPNLRREITVHRREVEELRFACRGHITDRGAALREAADLRETLSQVMAIAETTKGGHTASAKIRALINYRLS